MVDGDCAGFLKWALPRLGMRWSGFRRVRGQVCKRIARRMAALGIETLDGYRARLRAAPGEWRVLDRMCRVTISRFWRDGATFRALKEVVLPALADAAVGSGADRLDVWSCGCASGEEPYSLAMLWRRRLGPRFPGLRLCILATDLDLSLLRRAGRGVYPEGSVRGLPADLAAVALEPADGELRLVHRFRAGVHRVCHDVREGSPGGRFHLILCRNLAFTYFDAELQRKVAADLAAALREGGALVLGRREEIPGGVGGLRPWGLEAPVYRRG